MYKTYLVAIDELKNNMAMNFIFFFYYVECTFVTVIFVNFIFIPEITGFALLNHTQFSLSPGRRLRNSVTDSRALRAARADSSQIDSVGIGFAMVLGLK